MHMSVHTMSIYMSVRMSIQTSAGDAGMATNKHTPYGRGYESWTGYFNHCNDYWNQVDNVYIVMAYIVVTYIGMAYIWPI